MRRRQINVLGISSKRMGEPGHTTVSYYPPSPQPHPSFSQFPRSLSHLRFSSKNNVLSKKGHTTHGTSPLKRPKKTSTYMVYMKRTSNPIPNTCDTSFPFPKKRELLTGVGVEYFCPAFHFFGTLSPSCPSSSFCEVMVFQSVNCYHQPSPVESKHKKSGKQPLVVVY